MVKKVIIGILGVICAVFLVLGTGAEAFAESYTCITSVSGGTSSTPGTPSTPGTGTIDTVNEGSCTSILPNSWCTGGNGITNIITMVITIMTGAVVVAGTVGIIICGFTWMTARENEAQVAKAKKRMLEIVIGLIAWVLLALIANLFIPKTSDDIEEDTPGLGSVLQKQKLAIERVTLAETGYCAYKPSGGKVLTATEDSTIVACADGTTDLGLVDTAYIDGKKTTIRLCSIPSIKSTESDDNGHIRVNSRVSSAYNELGKKYSSIYHKQLSASQSYRTYEKQQYFYNCYVTKKCNNGNQAAVPGRSKHQSGLAVDFAMEGSGWSDQGISGFFKTYLSSFGLDRPVSDEPWHVAPKS